jgi:hypothetical protein
MEVALPFFANLVLLLLALIGIGVGIALTVRGVGVFCSGVARAVASPVLIVAGVWFLWRVIQRVG